MDVETFESLLNQSIGFENLQVIIVSSKFEKNVNRYAERYENVIPIKIKDSNSFYGQYYNLGMKHAASDNLMFLNSNDKIKEDCCELLYDEMIKDENDLVSGVLSAQDYENSNCHEELFIKNLNINDKLFKKSFIKENNIIFPEDSFDSHLAFLINVYLNAKNHKIINRVLIKHEKIQQNFSKKMIKGLLNTYYEMFYICNNHDNINFFHKYQLFDNLNYFIFLCSTVNLNINDLLELFAYSRPLFNLYYQNRNFKNENEPRLFRYIFKENYEEAISHIYGETTPKQKEITIATLCDSYTYNSFKFECDLFCLNSDWFNQMEMKKPELFLFTPHENININLEEVLNYCNENEIPAIVWENKQTNLKDINLSFDYIFTIFEKNISYYQNRGHENVHHMMYATQPALFNPINENKKLINIQNEECPERKQQISKTMHKIKNNFRNYRSNNLKNNQINVTYDQNSNLDKIDRIFKEMNKCPALTNDEYCNHEIFELMSLNRLIFTDYSEILFKLFENNIYYFNKDNIDFSQREINEIKNENLHNVLRNHTYSNRFKQILDTINFKYIPELKRIILFYKLDNLTELDTIYNHFHSIKYPYKQMKIITSEDKLYLPNTIIKSQLNEFKFIEKDYFVFADFNLDSDFVCDALLHSNYIDENIGIKEDIEKKFVFDKTNDISNVIFNASQYKTIISQNYENIDVFYFNNFQIKVSVIIPVFNVEDYLEECLESVINQTMKDIEIICINDGSYDSSLDILKEYKDKDSRIKIITQYNKGPGGARNTGLDIAKGKYIYFIDSDDIIEINGLKEMYEQSEFKQLDMLKFNLMTFEDETRKEKELYQRVKPAFLQELGDIIFDYKTIGSDVYTLSPNMQSSFFRREAVENIRFPEKLIFEDNIYLIEALFNSKRVYYYDKFLSNKRERKDSITKSTGRDFPDILEIRNMIVDLAKKYDFYEDYKFTIYSRKYMFIKLLFLQTAEYNKRRFFEKIKEDCINKKEEYEKEGIFDILDQKSIKIFNAGLNCENYKEFEELIKNA